MRLTPIAPADLTPEQRPLYDYMREGIAKSFKGFVAIRDDGALLGPWNPWLHEPSFGKASWDLVRALAAKPSLPKSVRELATLVTGQRPVDLTLDEAIAYYFASALVNGGVLPELTYKRAIAAFGQHGAAELSYLVGLYALVSITLNTFDVPVPEA